MQNKIVFVMFAIMVIPLAIFALTGEGTSGSATLDTVDPEVMVNYPNGGEELYIGDSADITWSATDFGILANSITISYSSDNGTNYGELASLEANDGTYYWELPSVISYSSLIKIIAEDNFGNVGEDVSDNVFSLTYAPLAAPVWVDIDISDNIDAVITWAEVDTTIVGNSITIDGYIVLYNKTAYEDTLQCYYYLANTNIATTNYTHQGVARFRDQMFYKVVAYKDYRGNINSILANLPKQNNFMSRRNDKLSWTELQRMFK